MIVRVLYSRFLVEYYILACVDCSKKILLPTKNSSYSDHFDNRPEITWPDLQNATTKRQTKQLNFNIKSKIINETHHAEI